MANKTTASNAKEIQGQQNRTDEEQIRGRLDQIAHQILVLSGKGGVGKSTVAANLAVSLVLERKRVGLLDIDIHGPSIPKILNLETKRAQSAGKHMLPVEVMPNFKVMSIGFLLPDKDDAVIWRGPMKYQMIKQFLKDVEWGSLDYLIVDSPPGTGDEPLSVIQLLKKADGAIIVTTPQEVALADVRKGISFCRSLSLPVIGVLENMSGFVCPKCGESTDIFKSGGGEDMAARMEVPFLGRLPIDPAIVRACDSGMPFVSSGDKQSETARALSPAVRALLDLDENSQKTACGSLRKEHRKMRIAIPLAQGMLSLHFGHCDEFALVDVDEQSKKVLDIVKLQPPAHEPGVLPRWLAEQKANLIIAGGMGQRAQQLFTQNGIDVVVGASVHTPEQLAHAYLTGSLESGENICDH